MRGLNPNEGGAGWRTRPSCSTCTTTRSETRTSTTTAATATTRYKHFIRKTGILDTARVNSMEIVWQILPNYNEPDTAQVSWNPADDLSLPRGMGTGWRGQLRAAAYRDGALLRTISLPGTWTPGGPQRAHRGQHAARGGFRRAHRRGVQQREGVGFADPRRPGAPAGDRAGRRRRVHTPVVFLEWTGVRIRAIRCASIA